MGPAGASGEAGAPGQQGQQGVPGTVGEGGVVVFPDGGSADGGTLAHAPYNPALDLKMSIDKSTIDATNTLVVEFNLTDKNGVPVTLPITSDGRIGTLTTLADGGTVFAADQVSISFVAAWLDGTAALPGYYTPYTMQNVSFDGGTVTKAATDNRTPTGSVIGAAKFAPSTKGDGWYTYTFGTKINPGANASKTHTVGAMAMRTVPGTPGVAAQYYPANFEFNWVPAGGAVTVTRDVVRRDNCNACHTSLGHHGAVDNARQDIQLCVLCHNPSTTNAASGNTINLGSLIHKIHAGTALPSNTDLDGGVPVAPFKIDTTDYSTVNFPHSTGQFLGANPAGLAKTPGFSPTGSNLANCAKCHANATNVANWKDNPSLTTCTTCHDRIYFTNTAPTTPTANIWVQHRGGTVNLNDGVNHCVECHAATKNADPVNFHHVVPTTVAATISAASITAGQLSVTFDLSVTDNTAVPPAPVHGAAAITALGKKGSLSVVLGGPVPDFKFGQDKNNSLLMYHGATATGTVAGAYTIDAANKITFTTTPAGLGTLDLSTVTTGTYGVGITGSAQMDPADAYSSDFPAGAAKPRYVIQNPVYYFNAATGAAATAPTAIAETARCNTCHESIPGHGGTRNQTELCRFCHQPSQPDRSIPNNLTVGPGVGQTVDFKVMIHDLHLGLDHTSSSWYGNVNAGGTPNALGVPGTPLVHYPDKIGNCSHCHASGTNLLPLYDGTQQASQSIAMSCTTNPCTTAGNTNLGGLIYTAPTTAVCTSCHDSTATAAHAQIMTINPGAALPQSVANPAGFAESCATCHGAGKAFDVAAVHTVTY